MSGGFEVGDILRIYHEKEERQYWVGTINEGSGTNLLEMNDLFDLFLKEGNLLWVIEEAGKVEKGTFPSRTSSADHGEAPAALRLRRRGQHAEAILEEPVWQQYLKIKLTNPENLNYKGPIRPQSGWLIYFKDAIYWQPEVLPYRYDPIYSAGISAWCGFGNWSDWLEEPPPMKTNWKVEIYEQNEVKKFIEALKVLYESDWFEDQTVWAEIGKYTKDNGGTWGDFLRTAWDEEFIQGAYLKGRSPGDTVYDKVKEYVKEQAFKVEEYVKEQAFKASNTTPDDLYAMSSDKKIFDMFAEGGGRKKRRKRRKTKRKKSKRKKSKKK